MPRPCSLRRNPGGLSGALQKIGPYGFGSRLESEPPPTCAICFSATAWANRLCLLATHPPIPDASAPLIQPGTANFPPLDEKANQVVKRAAISELEHTPKPMPDLFKTVLGGAIMLRAAPPRRRSSGRVPSCRILAIPRRCIEIRRAIAPDSLPESIKAAAREPLDASH